MVIKIWFIGFSDVNRPAEASAAFPAGLGRWDLNARMMAKSVKK